MRTGGPTLTPPSDECEPEFVLLWYAAQVTLKENGADSDKEAAIRVNYEHSEPMED